MSVTNSQRLSLAACLFTCLFFVSSVTIMTGQNVSDPAHSDESKPSLDPITSRSNVTNICNGGGYLTTHVSGGSNTKMWKIGIQDQDIDLQLLEQYPRYFNAVGYHRGTESFYGTVINTQDIVKVQLDGSIETVYTETDLGEWNALAGDCNFQDQFLAYERSNGTAYIYNLDPFTKETSVQLDWHSNTGIDDDNPVVFADVVFDPINPSWVYGFHGRSIFTGGTDETKGWILKFNVDPSHPEYGLMQKVMEVPEDTLFGIGAMFFGADLGLYLYGREDNTTDNNSLFRVDLSNEESNKVLEGPGARNVDGCSCLSGLKVTKTVENDPVPCGEDALFDIEVYWYGRETVNDVELKDTIDFGEEVVISSSDDWDDATVDPLPSGSHVITLNKSSMNKGDTINMTFRVSSIFDLTNCNQAYVSAFYNGKELLQPSDNPEIDGWHDPTCFEISGAGDIADELNITSSPTCPAGQTGALTIQWSGFSAGAEYVLFPFNDTLTASDGEIVWSDLSGGTYSLTEITEPGDSCSYYVDLDVRIPTWDEFTVKTDTALCPAESYQAEAQHPMIDIDRWRLLGQTQWNEAPVDISTVTQQNAGAYEVEYLVDSCTWRDTFEIGVLSDPFADYVNQYTGIPDESVQIVSEQLSQDIQSWSWSPQSGLNCYDCPEPMASNENIDNYTVRVTDENGCMDTVQIRIDWLSESGIYVPNTFTPNNDGINDIFTVYPSEWVLEFIETEIFNRWGDRVYHIKGSKPKWNGQFNGQRVANGVYVLVMKYRTQDQQVRVYASDITIAR